MTRFLFLALGALSLTSEAYADGLNINPFPMEESAQDEANQEPVVISIDQDIEEDEVMSLIESEPVTSERVDAQDLMPVTHEKKNVSKNERVVRFNNDTNVSLQEARIRVQDCGYCESAQVDAQSEPVALQSESQGTDDFSYSVSSGSVSSETLLDQRADNASKTDSVVLPMPGESADPIDAMLAEQGIVSGASEKASMRSGQIDLDQAEIKVIPSGPLPIAMSPDMSLSDIAIAGNFAPAYMTARPGEAVEDVLRSWSDTNNVGFLWQTRTRYKVKEPVDGADGYEQSVEALVSQFSDEQRPLAAKLNIDPVTGFRTLMVTTQ